MAIVKAPAFSLAASGNVGGICYSSHRGLNIVKSAWSGVVPNTTKQLIQQELMRSVSKSWGNTLNAANRQTYINLAPSIIWSDRFGSPYIPNGYQLFMKWNLRRKIMNLSIMVNAPAAQEFAYVERLRIYINVPTPYLGLRHELENNVWPDSYGTEYYKAGPYDSGGRHPIAGEWVFLHRDIPPDGYNDHDVIGNKWYWYRSRSISEFGDVANWFEAQAQVA